jgi:5-methylcytosine-specific restriction endonuclease McrA
MKWHYKCLKCGEWRSIEWETRDKEKECHKSKEGYMAPTPSNQPDAHVDTHEWPQDMEDAVVASKGNNCSVPGCKKNAETLDHRVPFSKGGRTSVTNLYPMCIEHNQSKNDSDYSEWLKTKRP